MKSQSSLISIFLMAKDVDISLKVSQLLGIPLLGILCLDLNPSSNFFHLTFLSQFLTFPLIHSSEGVKPPLGSQ